VKKAPDESCCREELNIFHLATTIFKIVIKT